MIQSDDKSIFIDNNFSKASKEFAPFITVNILRFDFQIAAIVQNIRHASYDTQ